MGGEAAGATLGHPAQLKEASRLPDPGVSQGRLGSSDQPSLRCSSLGLGEAKGQGEETKAEHARLCALALHLSFPAVYIWCVLVTFHLTKGFC